jgi:hypothetical protein
LRELRISLDAKSMVKLEDPGGDWSTCKQVCKTVDDMVGEFRLKELLLFGKLKEVTLIGFR